MMIKVYCDGCDALVEEIETFDWVKVEVKFGVLTILYAKDQDGVGFWCPDCRHKKERVFHIMKANKVSAIEQIGIDGKALLKSEMGKE